MGITLLRSLIFDPVPLPPHDLPSDINYTFGHDSTL